MSEIQYNHSEIPCIYDDRDSGFGVKTSDICPTQRAERNGLKVIVASRGRNPQNPSDRTPGADTEQRLEPNSEGICNTLTSVQKDNLVLEPKLVGGLGEKDWGSQWRQGNRVYDSNAVAMALHAQPVGNAGGNSYLYLVDETVKIKQATKDGYIECKLGGVADLSYPTSKTRRGRVQDNGDTCPTLTATETGICRIETPYRIRKLTPLECAKLMNFTEEDAEKMLSVNSNTQVYKQCGNSICTNVLQAIFSQMNIKGCPTWEEYAKEHYL